MALRPGERIRHWRELLGITQADLAERIKFDESKLSRIETGAQEIRAFELEIVVEKLGLTMAEFYGQAGAA